MEANESIIVDVELQRFDKIVNWRIGLLKRGILDNAFNLWLCQDAFETEACCLLWSIFIIPKIIKIEDEGKGIFRHVYC